ncbi:3-oxoacid CoA-transferase subunit B [Gemmobacter sp.]|uniref:3-oxoacid CoA-transferase subunit B n=1 Tax=Gemmobacter sp. TaxID=1898957 RepID=UPI002AFEE845|nr:3-oxoacid CoA-transferase subunit B [Gemmobacter sp.]
MTETPFLPAGVTPLNRKQMAARLARDIPEGWYVNLGIGIPTLVADTLPADREIILHTENGLLGMGPAPAETDIDPWTINAGKQFVTIQPGGAIFDQSDSFAMIRGGHLDLCVLGAFQVNPRGDIANWSTSAADTAPAVGGAMDLTSGARRVWVLTDHVTKTGEPKLVEQCTYPLTAAGRVGRIYTNLAVIDVTDCGFVLVESFGGISHADLQALTGAKLLTA